MIDTQLVTRVFFNALAVFVIHSCFIGTASQESLPSSAEGQPIRVTTDLFLRPAIGILHEVSKDSIWLLSERNYVVGLPLERVQLIEIEDTNRLKGALVGAGAGALLATTALAIWGHSQGGFTDCANCPFIDAFALAALLGVPVGGSIGAITGAIIGLPSWDPLPGFERGY